MKEKDMQDIKMILSENPARLLLIHKQSNTKFLLLSHELKELKKLIGR